MADLPRTLEQVLADWRGDAQRLRALGHPVQAATIEQVVDEVTAAAEPYLDWLDEETARTRSGRSVEYWRARFAALLDQGLARWQGRKRQYRRCAIPHRANLEAARAAARREAAA